jgi:hypothetical protein
MDEMMQSVSKDWKVKPVIFLSTRKTHSQLFQALEKAAQNFPGFGIQREMQHEDHRRLAGY